MRTHHSQAGSLGQFQSDNLGQSRLNKAVLAAGQRPIMFHELRDTSEVTLNESENSEVSIAGPGSLNKAAVAAWWSDLERRQQLAADLAGGDCTLAPGRVEKISENILGGAGESTSEPDSGASAPSVTRAGEGGRPDAGFGVASPAALAPATCNTGAMDRQGSPSEAQQEREKGGVDTYAASLYGEWNALAWELREAEFDELLGASQESPQGGFWKAPNGERLKMLPSGARHGGHCPWLLEWNGCHLSIQRRREESKDMLSIFVEMGSLPLMRDGLAATWERLQRLLRSVGFRLRRDVPSRLDMCVDLPGVHPRELWQPYAEGRFISRVHDRETSRRSVGCLFHGFEPTDVDAFQRGHRTRCLVRVYDKLKEVRNDPEKRYLLMMKRWGCVMPDAATRVEFQFARSVLKEKFNCNSTADVLALLPQMTAWCCDDWFRLTAEVLDRENNNQSRAGVHPLWALVQECFAAWSGANTRSIEVPREVTRPKASALLRQAMGCLASMFGLQGKTFGGGGWELLASVRHSLDEILSANISPGFVAKVDGRAAAYGVKMGLLSSA